MSAAAVIGAPVTLEYTGTRGSLNLTCASTCSQRMGPFGCADQSTLTSTSACSRYRAALSRSRSYRDGSRQSSNVPCITSLHQNMAIIEHSLV